MKFFTMSFLILLSTTTWAQQEHQATIETVAEIASDKINTILPAQDVTEFHCIQDYSAYLLKGAFKGHVISPALPGGQAGLNSYPGVPEVDGPPLNGVEVGVHVLKDGVGTWHMIYVGPTEPADLQDFARRWPAHMAAITKELSGQFCSHFQKKTAAAPAKPARLPAPRVSAR